MRGRGFEGCLGKTTTQDLDTKVLCDASGKGAGLCTLASQEASLLSL